MIPSYIMLGIFGRKSSALPLNVVHVLVPHNHGVVLSELPRDVMHGCPFRSEAGELCRRLTISAI